MTDSFDAEQLSWLANIPGDVDAIAEGVRQRIGRTARQFERLLAVVAGDHGVSVGDWEALSVLARSEQPQVTPGELAGALRVTSGTVSVRIDRLVAAGLVEIAKSNDRRSRPVRLTDAGRAVWGDATLARTTLERDLLRAALGEDDLADLNRLLATLLARLERQYGPAPRHDMTRGQPN